MPEDFGLQVKAEKTNALSHSLNLLRAGMSEAKVRQTGRKREREREKRVIKGLDAQFTWWSIYVNVADEQSHIPC